MEIQFKQIASLHISRSKHCHKRGKKNSDMQQDSNISSCLVSCVPSVPLLSAHLSLESSSHASSSHILLHLNRKQTLKEQNRSRLESSTKSWYIISIKQMWPLNSNRSVCSSPYFKIRDGKWRGFIHLLFRVKTVWFGAGF